MIDEIEEPEEHIAAKPVEYFFLASALHALSLVSGLWYVGVVSLALLPFLFLIPYIVNDSSQFQGGFGEGTRAFVRRFELYPYEVLCVPFWILGTVCLFVEPLYVSYIGVIGLVVSSILMQQAQGINSLSPLEKKGYRESRFVERLRLACSGNYRKQKHFDLWEQHKKTSLALEDAEERASVKEVFREEKTQNWEDSRKNLSELRQHKIDQIDERVEKWLVQESSRLLQQESERPFQLSSERNH